MAGWFNALLIVISIIALIALVLYFLSVIYAYKVVKKGFTCKYVHCNKLNSAIHKNCDYCGHEMEPWKKPIYISIFRQRKDCTNKEGFPDLKVTKRYMIFDEVILGTAIIVMILVLVKLFTM